MMKNEIDKTTIYTHVLEHVKIKDPEKLTDEYLFNNELIKCEKDGKIYKRIDFEVYGYVPKDTDKSLKFPFNHEQQKYGIKIDKIGKTISRLFINEDVYLPPMPQVSMTEVAAYMLINLHYEGINPYESLSKQFYNVIQILIDRGNCIIPIHVKEVYTGKYRSLEKLKLSKYGEIKTKEDFCKVIFDQFNRFSELEIAEDFPFDIRENLNDLMTNNYKGTLYSTDYRARIGKKRRYLSFATAYNKKEKENYKYDCFRLECRYRYQQVARFQKLLTPEALDKPIDEIIKLVSKDTMAYYERQIGDFDQLKKALPESKLLSLFSQYAPKKKKPFKLSVNPVIQSINEFKKILSRIKRDDKSSTYSGISESKDQNTVNEISSNEIINGYREKNREIFIKVKGEDITEVRYEITYEKRNELKNEVTSEITSEVTSEVNLGGFQNHDTIKAIASIHPNSDNPAISPDISLNYDKCDSFFSKTTLTNSIVGIAIKYIRRNINVFLPSSTSESDIRPP